MGLETNELDVMFVSKNENLENVLAMSTTLHSLISKTGGFMKSQRIAVPTAILATTLASGIAMAQDPGPCMKPDDTWITINGTVEDVTRDAFKLDYGSGMVMVEMDDGDRDADAY